MSGGADATLRSSGIAAKQPFASVGNGLIV
jgi:hypothetical protein